MDLKETTNNNRCNTKNKKHCITEDTNGIPLNEKPILCKIHKEDLEIDLENVHEKDNVPNAFRDLSLAELEYLDKHRELLRQAFPNSIIRRSDISNVYVRN